ncbi:unnamed protein product [Oppiella nova]|uniref:Cytochrome P450 n=1 Tax=Oppiella nova TaxID=334625 RepID=A0A7R9MDD2_9ACAR|nr:unnamed protein product [Oppiella nova]CAG2174086.1 unnamed protein product [Oppiella nova]
MRRVLADRKAQGSLGKGQYNDFIQLLLDADVTVDRDEKVDNNGDDQASEWLANTTETTAQSDRHLFNNTNKRLSEREIYGTAMTFFFAGFSTTPSALAFCAYELALNPDIQRKLYDEINGAIDSDGEIPYDALTTRLPYLDAVVTESIRLHPSSLRLRRNAGADYELEGTGITLKAGEDIDIPVFALHYSPDYWPNPYKFDPDRFMPDNRHLNHTYAYLPFGTGPRGCVGN